MAACRQSYSFWIALRDLFSSRKRMKIGPRYRIFSKRLYQSSYFWHDTLGKYWNRLFRCWNGHEKIQNVSDLDEPEIKYCFCCERYLDNKYLKQ